MMYELGVLAVVAAVVMAAMALVGSETCFSTSEKVDGLNKICFYSCPSGDAAITIGATALCPLSIKR